VGLTKFLRGRAAGAMGPVLDELLYFELFRGQLEALDLPMIYRPFGAGANASLLFLVLRCVQLHRPKRVLELGAGQTSLLLDALSTHYPMEVVAVEGDQRWRDDIGGRVRHDVRLCAIEQRRYGRHSVPAYDLPQDVKTGSFNMIVVDGPGGARRFGRVGALDLVPDALAEDGVVLFDNVERRGEQDTVALAEERLAGARGQVQRMTFAGRTRQALLAPARTRWLGQI